MKPPPDFPSAPYPFLLDGGLAPAERGNAVLSIAIRYLGVPYTWGGARPKTGFDCSGLVQYVFAQLGVALPHNAAAQYHSPDAVWVSPNRLQPGDLVFFIGSDGTREAPGHVGIYAGDGYIIDAPHTGAKVRADSLDAPWFANEYVGAKRIVASLHARQLFDAPRDGTSFSTFLPRQMAAVGESLPTTAVVPIAAHTSVSRDYRLWTGVALGGVVLLLCAGVIAYRRRGLRSEVIDTAESP